jgi:glutathione-specific gamma-glutamylcyclotransferase
MSDIWVFGYGSLIWRPDFPFEEARIATVAGWGRRFWQGSTDHRGVPGAPGRVVTLIEDPQSVCWGRAYLISAHSREEVINHLDYREKGGYSLHQTEMMFPGTAQHPADGLIYIATPGNPNWLGEAPISDIAAQVRSSEGPSGLNTEYVLELARALSDMGADDPHVFELARHVAGNAAGDQA